MTRRLPQPDAAQPSWARLRRPRMFAGAVSGISAYALLGWAPTMTGPLRFILAWDLGVTVALLALFFGLRRTPPHKMRDIAARQTAGKWTVLGLTVFAACASLVAIAGEVPMIKTAGQLEEAARIALVLLTIVLSWALIHTVFALHYAHDYYIEASSDDPQKAGPAAGIAFPGHKPLSYGDFVYFAFTIGMTFQVSDVQITDPAVRRLAIAHGMISFFYATGILALTVNLLAGLL